LMASGRRKMLAAREDLADAASRLAAEKGYTLFSFVNNLLELAVRVESSGGSLEKAVENYALAKAVSEASFTLVLESALYGTAEIAYQKARTETLRVWYEAGVWVAKHYSNRGVKDPLTAIERGITFLSWNIPEFRIETHGNMASVRVLAPRFNESYTMLFLRFLEGILETVEYRIIHKDVGRGNIRLEAVKRGVNVKG
jgi:hypothetical protein